MSEQHLIEKLERHFGFVIQRFNCDGNYYSLRIRPAKLDEAERHFTMAMLALKAAVKGVYPEDTTLADLQFATRCMMDKFDDPEFEDEKEHWE